LKNQPVHRVENQTFKSFFFRRSFAVLALISLLVPIASATTVNLTNGTIEVQIIALNDLHGQLEPPSGNLTLFYNGTGKAFKVPTGGIEYLATQIKGLEATNPNTVIVSAGDNIGASPLVSALFHDEPTIEALSQIGLTYSAVGNHEFNGGVGELERMQYGCCNQTEGCLDGDRFVGAGFRYLTANVVNETTGKTLLSPYEIQYIQGIPVAFIGVSLEDTPTITLSSEVRGLKFLDEADSINGIVRELKQKGVKTIIVLLHDGGSQNGLPSESINLRGPILDVVNRTDDEVDVFVTGHTHDSYISNINGRLVTQAGCKGQFLTDIDLIISKETGDVVKARAKNVAVTRDVPRDPAVSEIVEKYSVLASPLADRVIGSITSSITKNDKASGESALGDLIADAQLFTTSRTERAVAAFMNPGGIRTDLHYQTTGNGRPGNVTYGEAFSVQPFRNILVTMNLTGSQIDDLFEQQFDNPSPGEKRILQVSKDFAYAWNNSMPTGRKVDINSIKIDDTFINPNSSYRITVNNFLADGGDNFTVLKAGTDRIYGAVDLDALVEYFKAFSPISPGPMDRIKAVR
jgi:5'-nucleotidase